ncbi:ROK family transcriptional regulator [Streptomyces lavendulae]|uniref:ROK family transcriptional regulator n=1 Tax=Streptomyces lavendulae TaxID=1914 RepID=UPI0024A2F2F6|nr:ROK family transcriptional regulator [Streptomyces lavendulae]GLX16575.1 sugar kinase [Streptomyces lavendulae subsp. lavendulae]GLX25195.1 sugar kinase [Streptomyces lavendulae subsp. lavendulae]
MPAPLDSPYQQLRGGDGRREANTSAVLRTVLDHGPVARRRIAALTGLSPAAVSRQVVDLARLGLVRERPELVAAAGVGRPQVPVDIDSGRVAVAGVHIGVPGATLSLIDLRGRILAREDVSSRGLGRTAILERVTGRLPAFLAAHKGALGIAGVGAVLGGRVDPERGIAVRHEPLGWYDVPLRDALERATGLPVYVDNHARALAQSEILFGHPDAQHSIVAVFVGHVVDAALGSGGRVHLGPRAATSDLAHQPVPGSRAKCPCGRTGCFEAVVSDTALFREAAERGIIAEPDRALLSEAVAAGHPGADRLVRRRARLIGRAVALLADLVNPDVVVVHETFSGAHPRYLDAIRAEAVGRSHLCDDPERIVAPGTGERALDVAAGTAVLANIYGDPLRTVAFDQSPGV